MNKSEMGNPWIETFTGGKFHLLEPSPEEIDERDIAHALSNQCRFTGHVKRFYSVAEHSWRASKLVTKEYALEALLHDGSEAYLSDLSRPVKHCTRVGEPYRQLEDTIMRAISTKFGIPYPMSQAVKEADEIMLYTEKAQLMGGVDWTGSEGHDAELLAKVRQSNVGLVGYAPEVMEKLFLQRFYELT